MIKQKDINFFVVNPWIGFYAKDYSFYRINRLALGAFQKDKKWYTGLFYRIPDHCSISYLENPDLIFDITEHKNKKEAVKYCLSHYKHGHCIPYFDTLHKLAIEKRLLQSY